MYTSIMKFSLFLLLLMPSFAFSYLEEELNLCIQNKSAGSDSQRRFYFNITKKFDENQDVSISTEEALRLTLAYCKSQSESFDVWFQKLALKNPGTMSIKNEYQQLIYLSKEIMTFNILQNFPDTGGREGLQWIRN